MARSGVKLPKFGGKTGESEFNDRFEQFFSILVSNLFLGVKQKDFDSTESKLNTINNKQKSLLGMIEDQNKKMDFIVKYYEERKKLEEKAAKEAEKARKAQKGPQASVNEIIVEIAAKGDLAALDNIVKFLETSVKTDDKNLKKSIHVIESFSTLCKSLTRLSDLEEVDTDLVDNALEVLSHIIKKFQEEGLAEKFKELDKNVIKDLTKFTDKFKDLITNISELGDSLDVLGGFLMPLKVNPYINFIKTTLDTLTGEDFHYVDCGIIVLDDIKKFVKRLKSTIDMLNKDINGEYIMSAMLNTLVIRLFLWSVKKAINYVVEDIDITALDNANKKMPKLVEFSKGIAEVSKSMNEIPGIFSAIMAAVSTKIFLWALKQTIETVIEDTKFDGRKLRGANKRIGYIAEIAKSLKTATLSMTTAGLLAIPAIIAIIPVGIFLIAFKGLLWLANKLFGSKNKDTEDSKGLFEKIGDLFSKFKSTQDDGGDEDDKKKSKGATAGFFELAKAVAIVGMTLLLGSLFLSLIDVGAVLQFAAITGIFMIAMAGVMKIVDAAATQESIAALKRLTIMVVVCATILLIGAAFMMIEGMAKNAMVFAFLLAGFIFVIALVFLMFKTKQKDAFKGAAGATALVLVSGIILLIGGLMFTLYPELKANVALFAIELAAFIGAVVLIFKTWGKQAFKELGDAKAVAMLVGISGLVLALGPVILAKEFGTDLAGIGLAFMAVAAFGVALAGFMWVMLGIANRLNKRKKDVTGAIISAKALAIIIGAATAALIAGPVAMHLLGIPWETLAVFTAGIVAATWAFIKIMKMLDKAKSSAVKAVVPAAIAGIIMVGLVGSVVAIASVVPKIKDNLGTFFATLGFMAAMVTGIIGIAYVLSAGGLFLLPGLAVMGVVTGIALMLSVATLNIANAVQAIKDIPEEVMQKGAINCARIVGLMFAAIGGLITGEMILMKSDGTQEVIHCGKIPKEYLIEGIFTKSPFGVLVSNATKIGDIISNIAEGLKGYAELKLPTGFKPDGTPTGFRPFEDKDFNLAAINMSRIVGLMFMAIGGLVTGDMILTDANGKMTRIAITPVPAWALKDGLLTDSPFTVLVKNAARIGDIISNISKGLQDYAELKIATGFDPETGKPTGYERMKDSQFNDAATNIANVVCGMFVPFIRMANGEFDPSQSPFTQGLNKQAFQEFFEEGWFSKSKAQLLLQNAKELGEIISNLSKGIQDYANFRIAKKWNEKGEPIEWDVITDETKKAEIFGAAQKNIGEIITGLFTCLINLSEDDNFKNLDKTAMDVLEGGMKALKPMTEILANITGIMGQYAEGKICKYDEKGKPVGPVFDINQTNIDNAISNIRLTVRGLVNSFKGIMVELQDLNLFGYTDIESEDLESELQSYNYNFNSVVGSVQVQTKKFKETSAEDLAKYMKAQGEAKEANIDNFIKGTIGVLDRITNSLSKSVNNILNILKSMNTNELVGKLFTDMNGRIWLNESMYALSVGLTDASYITKWAWQNTRFISESDVSNLENKFGYINNLLGSAIRTFGTVSELMDTESKTKKQGKSPIVSLGDDISYFSIKMDGLNTQKFNDVINLANAVTNMGKYFGGIDKLVEAITKHLTEVLKKLIAQLSSSATTINKAEKIQAARHKLIQNAIKDVEGLMKQQLNVIIKQEDPENTPSGLGSNSSSESPGGGNPSDGQQSSNGRTLAKTPQNGKKQ